MQTEMRLEELLEILIVADNALSVGDGDSKEEAMQDHDAKL